MRWARSAALVAVAGLIGCGSDEDRIQLVRVTGTITKDGKPLPSAKVTYFPEAGNKDATPGVDETGADGNYMVKFKGRTGVAPGKYKVTITPAVETPVDSKVPDEIKNDPMMMLTGQEARGLSKKAARAEPKKVELKNEFPAEVPDQASVTLDFDVKRKG
jgi:hypothetical protein